MEVNNKIDIETINENIKKNINDNNYSIDNTNLYLSRVIKFSLNFILIYIFLEFIFNPNYEFTRTQLILLICIFSSVLLYILDLNYPSCSLTNI